MLISRRNFLLCIGAGIGAGLLGKIKPSKAQSLLSLSKRENYSPFELPPLPYAYDALEPYIDAETMRFHHDKHHAGYTKKLNQAVAYYPQLANRSLEQILSDIKLVPLDIYPTIRNNGGGYCNHSMYWESMSPDGGGEPTGAIAQALEKTFGSFENFKEQFNKAGSQQFGSGWAWLVLDGKQLEVMGTANQDSPLMYGKQPILGNDVWEHAYYLKYRNRRGEYLKQWWNIVNWEEVNKRYKQAIS